MTTLRKSSDLIPSQTRLAEEINTHFQIPCSKQQVQNWQRKHNPPFPSGNAKGQYSRKECFAWVEANIIQPMKADVGAVNTEELLHKAVLAKAQREIDRARREKVLADEAEGLYITRQDARSKAIAVLHQYHAFVRVELEQNAVLKRREKMQALGVQEGIIAAFFAWDTEMEQNRIDRIAAQCAVAANDTNAIAI